jgi:hypothetical protein
MDVQKKWLHLYAMRRSLVGKRIFGIRAHQKFPARYQNHATGRIGRWTASRKEKNYSKNNEVACHGVNLVYGFAVCKAMKKAASADQEFQKRKMTPE